MNMTTAVLFTLTAAFLFASWYQSLKYLDDYPMSGFVLWLYISSFITITVALIILGPRDMPKGILSELIGKGKLAFGVIAGGYSMAMGLTISIVHMRTNGMVANMAISGTVSSITGLLLTFVVGGLSPDLSIGLVLLSSAILIVASIITQYASMLKNKEILEINKTDENRSNSLAKELQNLSEDELKKYYMKQNFLLILSNVLLMGYSVSYMLGTKSELHPNGFPALLCVFLLVVGSLLAALTYAIVDLTKTKRWKDALNPKNKKPIYLALLSGVCHYGGNLLTIYSLPLLSAPVSNLLWKTSTIWTYFWGLIYGEFKGSSKKSKTILFIGIGAFIFGTILLAFGLY